jgi:hypothetical protein
MPLPGHKNFVFNDCLNSAFLQDFFDGDMGYAETVFNDCLAHLPLYWKEVNSAHVRGSIPELKSAVHKCKTLFGYIGFSSVQDQFQAFEHKCTITQSMNELDADFESLDTKINLAIPVIETELGRLKAFNSVN